MTATAARNRRRPAPVDVEHRRCEKCGWTLGENLTGHLYCFHGTCTLRGQTVETLARDIGSLGELL